MPTPISSARSATPAAGRARFLWIAVRDSLWFVPALAALLAGALAVLLVRVPPPDETGALGRIGLFAGDAEGARSVLSAIAGGLITVTGVVFSVTIVALQLASSQFSPRILRSFVADRTNQVVLGVFIGTFTYSLLVLRSIRSEGPGEESSVPQVAVVVALALLLVSIGALIVYINHAARSIQASVILERETRLALGRIREMFGAEAAEGGTEDAARPPAPDGRVAHVSAERSGYVQTVRAGPLAAMAARRGLAIRMEARVGSFVLPGKPLASVRPADAADDDVCAQVRAAFLLGPERTPEQDVEFGIVEISDIAVRALSPGINDPTTAMLCIDRLGEVLLALAARGAPTRPGDGDASTIGFVPLHTTFERAAGLAFDQIRHYGGANPAIAKKLLDALLELAPLVGTSEREVLAAQVNAVAESARLGIEHPEDARMVQSLAQQALARLGT